MRAVIDTNVRISGILWPGPPHVLLALVRAGNVSLVSSPALLAELADVIGRAKFDVILKRTNTSREHSLAEVRRLAEVIDPPALPQSICRDPDDDAVLALAVAAKVELIVSGDDDLLSLKMFARIPMPGLGRGRCACRSHAGLDCGGSGIAIVTASEARERLGARGAA